MALEYKIIPVTPFAQNCSLIWCTDTREAAVIDPGGDIERIKQAIKAEGVTVKQLLLTHAHIDHAGGTGALSKELGVDIVGPGHEDKFWIDALESQSQMFGFPRVEAFEPNRWLSQDDAVSVGKQSLQVLHCPGHTPGHVVFYHADSATAWVGDVLFQGSIGRTDFPRGNHGDLLASITEKLLPLGDEVTFIPGHGPNSTFGHERLTNPFITMPSY